MKNYKISIIVPTFNSIKYINECLDSIICQTYNNFEVIAIDDGSFDGTTDIISKYIEKDDRIKLFVKENGGVSSARNLGLSKASGDYIMFVDSDDFLSDKSCLEKLINNIDDVEIINFSYSEIHNDCNDARLLNMSKDYYKDGIEYIDDVLKNGGFDWFLWRYIYKKELWENIVFPEGRIFEDTNTIYKILLKANGIRIINEPLYSYRINDNSLSKNVTYKICDDMIYIINKTSDDINVLNIPLSTKELLLNNLSFGFISVIGAMNRMNDIDKKKTKDLLKNNIHIINNCKFGLAKKMKSFVKLFGIDFTAFFLKIRKMAKNIV